MTKKEFQDECERLEKIQKDLQARGEINIAHQIYFKLCKFQNDHPEFAN